MDKISIHGLRVETRIGVSEEERARPRPLLIDIDIWADLIQAGTSDDLVDTIDYHAVITEIAEMVQSMKAKLLEHVAERIASVIGAIEGVDGVSVEVTKESPPVAEAVTSVSVRIDRAAG
jgi:dihydroneopterin aldolase